MTDLKPSDRNVNRAIRSWLHEDRHEDVSRVAGAVLDQVETIPQRRATWWPAWRTPIMNKFVTYGLGAAAAVVLALVVGIQLFGSPDGGLGSQATDPTPSPTPVAVTLASGSFAASLGEFGEAFDIEATKTGDDVSGTLDVSTADSAYSVDLQCARTTDVGQLIIAGEVSKSTSEFIVDGVYVAIMLDPGPPAGMFWWADVLPSDEVPSPADSCSGFLDTIFSDPGLSEISGALNPIEGDLELGQ